MNELNQILAENLGVFFTDLRDEVVKGLNNIEASKMM